MSGVQTKIERTCPSTGLHVLVVIDEPCLVSRQYVADTLRAVLDDVERYAGVEL